MSRACASFRTLGSPTGAELGEHPRVVGHVVPVVAQRRGEERRHPQAVDAEPLQVVELVDQAAEVARAVAVAVLERPDEHFVEHRRLEPLRLGAARGVGEGLLREDRDRGRVRSGLCGHAFVLTFRGRSSLVLDLTGWQVGIGPHL